MSESLSNALLHRIEELEARLAFQDDTIESLDRVITEQDRQLFKHQQQLQLLAEKLKTVEIRLPGGDDAPVDERPPHY